MQLVLFITVTEKERNTSSTGHTVSVYSLGKFIIHVITHKY